MFSLSKKFLYALQSSKIYRVSGKNCHNIAMGEIKDYVAEFKEKGMVLSEF